MLGSPLLFFSKRTTSPRLPSARDELSRSGFHGDRPTETFRINYEIVRKSARQKAGEGRAIR